MDPIPRTIGKIKLTNLALDEISTTTIAATLFIPQNYILKRRLPIWTNENNMTRTLKGLLDSNLRDMVCRGEYGSILSLLRTMVKQGSCQKQDQKYWTLVVIHLTLFHLHLGFIVFYFRNTITSFLLKVHFSRTLDVSTWTGYCYGFGQLQMFIQSCSEVGRTAVYMQICAALLFPSRFPELVQ